LVIKQDLTCFICNTNRCSSTTVDELFNLSVASSGTALAYFYFDFNDNARQTVDSLVRSIISQLVAQKADTIPALEALFAQSEEGTRQAPFCSLFATILPMLRSFEKTYVVIDALDECTECNELLQALQEIHEWGENGLHVLVTSRQTSEIQESLTELASDKLCVHESTICEDIDVYLTASLEHDRKLAKLPPDIRADIYNTLIDKSGGM
jgi:ankyrin repeat domain-containing protein 50